MSTWTIKRSLVLPQEAANYILTNLAFFGCVASLVVVYIYIAHNGQHKVREYQSLQKEVKALRWEYLTVRSELMVNSRQSVLALQVPGMQSEKTGTVPHILSQP